MDESPTPPPVVQGQPARVETPLVPEAVGVDWDGITKPIAELKYDGN